MGDWTGSLLAIALKNAKNRGIGFFERSDYIELAGNSLNSYKLFIFTFN